MVGKKGKFCSLPIAEDWGFSTIQAIVIMILLETVFCQPFSFSDFRGKVDIQKKDKKGKRDTYKHNKS